MEAPKKKTKKPNLYQRSHHGGEHEEGEGNWLVSYADMMTLLVGFFVILMSFSSVDQKKMEEAQKSVSKKFGGTFDRPYGEVADRVKKALESEHLGNSYVVRESQNGIEISFLGTVFFDSGSVNIKNEGMTILGKMLPVILQESKEYNILIEGHTDDVPVTPNATFRNNWELSSLRACRVLAFFEASGFKKEKLTAVGFADNIPELPNRNPDGSPNVENQSKNRRVVIKISKGDSSMLNSTLKK